LPYSPKYVIIRYRKNKILYFGRKKYVKGKFASQTNFLTSPPKYNIISYKIKGISYKAKASDELAQAKIAKGGKKLWLKQNQMS